MSKRIFFLSIGCLFFGVVAGMFVMKTTSDLGSTKTETGFSTQSVGEDTVSYMCPRSEEYLSGKQVRIANPISEKAHTIVSLQSGLSSINYEQRGPTGSGDGWKAVLVPQLIDSIRAVEKNNEYYCLYSRDDVEILWLRHDAIHNLCKVSNTTDLIGFICG